MEEEKITTNNSNNEGASGTVASVVPPVSSAEQLPNGRPQKFANNKSRSFGDSFGPRKKNFKTRRQMTKPEFDSAILDIRRVTRVVRGGRRFSFSVHLVAGDKNGRVGVGAGKSGDTSSAIEKATRDAKKNMIKVSLTKEMLLPCETSAKFSSAVVSLKPAHGRGLIAGSSVRNVLMLAGITDVNAKILSRSKNKINNARAVIIALKKLDKLCKSTK